jgi:hypothetical protein
MAVPNNEGDTFTVMTEVINMLYRLQRRMRSNAITWKAIAVANGVAGNDVISVEQLASMMNTAAVTYQTNLGQITTLQANTVEWDKLVVMWGILGGTAASFQDKRTPLNAVANQLGPADKSTYAAIIIACDQIITAINAPLSLTPE